MGTFKYNIDEVLNGIIECHEFCEDITLGKGLVTSFKAAIKEAVVSFLDSNIDLFEDYDRGNDGLGHDLYFTSLGHGVGFWDRGLEFGDEITKRLKNSEASKVINNQSDYYCNPKKS